MIKEAYVSFETAKLLKEKGFDEEIETEFISIDDICIFKKNNYSDKNSTLLLNEYSAPTHQIAMAWLREVHNIHIGINPISGKGYYATIYDVADFDDYGIISDTEFFFHPEEAVEAALKYCLENLI